MNGKVLVDISNPLDFSQGMTPILSVSNTDPLGEQIQRRFCEARIVKTLHTLMVYRIARSVPGLYVSFAFHLQSCIFRSGAEGIRTPDLRRAKAV